jgi:hypothetical protein
MSLKHCVIFSILLIVTVSHLLPDTPVFKEIPCPEPKPRFDAAAMDRNLKEPKYGGTPMYLFLALGKEGKQVVACVADESQGEGKGVDRVYIDINCNKDITEEEECFKLEQPYTASKLRKSKRMKTAPPAHLRGIGWPKGAKSIYTGKLGAHDPDTSYSLKLTFSYSTLYTKWNDGTYREGWHFVPKWSVEKEKALVIRAGGNEFAFKHEEILNKTFIIGDSIKAEATKPFFAGTTHSGYVHWGNKSMKASIESVETPSPYYKIPISIGKA